MDPLDSAEPPAEPAKGQGPLARVISRFMSDPSSGRNAILLIVVATIVTVLIGGVLVWVLDRPEFADLGEAFWFALQTVTTVGYGDVTPEDPRGRFVGAGLMLLGIAFLSVLTASITSSFIEARQAERRGRQAAEEAANQRRLEVRLDALIERLDRLEELERREPDRGS